MTSVQMKKNRPGFLLTLLCEPNYSRLLADWLLANTTSLGVRVYQQQRFILPRTAVTIPSPWGPIRGKRLYCLTVRVAANLNMKTALA